MDDQRSVRSDVDVERGGRERERWEEAGSLLT